MECVIQVPIVNLTGQSFKHWLVNQPVKLGGLGLRSLVETSPAAFVECVEMSPPFFAGDEGEDWICPQLEDVIGKV